MYYLGAEGLSQLRRESPLEVHGDGGLPRSQKAL